MADVTRRLALSAILLLLVASPLAGIVAADTGSSSTLAAQQQANNTTQTAQQTNWTAPGPFSIEELETGGTKLASSGNAEPPDSGRSLGTGGVIVRHRPVSLIDSSYKRLESMSVVNANQINLKTQAYLEAAGEYELVLVYWEEKTARVNGTARTYAANQTVQRASFTVNSGYDASTVKLQPHYDKTVRVTAWLERNGERVDGARWLFKHRSNPLAASPSFAINGKTDLWRWAAMFVVVPGLLGLLASGKAAQHVLERTVVGAQRGPAFWGAILAVVAVIGGGVATFATAAVLANAPVVAGLGMAVVGFLVMLGINDAEVQKAGFFQRRIDDGAVTPSGDDAASSRKVPNRVKKIVERGSTLYAPKSGIRPMLARYWADPAAVPRSDLETVDEGDEDSELAKMYEIDPAADEVLRHTPAHLTFNPSLTLDVDDDELVSPPEGDGVAALPAAIAAATSNFIARLNLRFIAIAVGAGALLYFGAMQVFGTQLVAGALAVMPGLIAGTEAVDGTLAVEPAPYHYSDVRATVATERKEYVSRKTFEELHKEIQSLDWKTLDRAQDTVQALRQEMSDKMDQMFGTDLPDIDGSGDDSDDDGEPWMTDPDAESGVADD